MSEDAPDKTSAQPPKRHEVEVVLRFKPKDDTRPLYITQAWPQLVAEAANGHFHGGHFTGMSATIVEIEE